MISDYVYELCHEKETLTSRLAREPNKSPGDVAGELFQKKAHTQTAAAPAAAVAAQHDAERAAQCGQWGSSVPSELFLKVRSSSSSS